MDIRIEEKSAAILRFPRRRGRPRKMPRPDNDTGTPELVMKRLLGETAEALDLSLERGIITRQQHWCGIHLRWLYTLRHGAPGITALDPTHLGGIELKTDDPLWRDAREKEFHEAMAVLVGTGQALIVLNLCIYNERPRFLSLHRPVKLKACRETERLVAGLQEGLEALRKHWGR